MGLTFSHVMGLTWKRALGQEHGLWVQLGESQAPDVRDRPFLWFLGSWWDPNVLAVYLKVKE